MPLPSKNTWRSVTREERPAAAPNVYTRTDDLLQRIQSAPPDFSRFVAMVELLDALRPTVVSRTGPTEAIAALYQDACSELLWMFAFVPQDECLTLSGDLAKNPRYIISMGFFSCLGIVLHDPTSMNTTLGHMNLACEPDATVETLCQDFLAKTTETALPVELTATVVGGRMDTEKGRTRVGEVREALTSRGLEVEQVPSPTGSFSVMVDRQTGEIDTFTKMFSLNNHGMVSTGQKQRSGENDARKVRIVHALEKWKRGEGAP